MPVGVGTLSDPELELLDPLCSPRLANDLPCLAAARDPVAVAELLGRALAGSPDAGRIEHCELAHARLLADGGCLLRYRLEVSTEAGVRARIVNARLFGSAAAARHHLEARLRPLAERAAGRDELRPFAASVAILSALRMAVSVFPVDGELPTLVDASDPATVGPLLGWDRALSRGHCGVALARYGRGNRCVLRYTMGTRIAYGKVADDDRGALADAVINALVSALPHAPLDRRFTVPRSLGYHPLLRLLLLEPAPGVPELSRLLKAHARGEPSAVTGVERALRTCAEIAAGLHTSGVAIGSARPAAAEVGRLEAGIAAVAGMAPALGDWLMGALQAVCDGLEASPELRSCLCHGDLKHNQILIDGGARALVDFDTVCQAEPALDLGHFLGYLRLKTPVDAADRFADLFLERYVDAAGLGRDGREALRRRVAAYEGLSLLGRAVHSFQKFKPARLALIIHLLEERLACQTP
jgi:Phosphotransferase enzyme family